VVLPGRVKNRTVLYSLGSDGDGEGVSVAVFAVVDVAVAVAVEEVGAGLSEGENDTEDEDEANDDNEGEGELFCVDEQESGCCCEDMIPHWMEREERDVMGGMGWSGAGAAMGTPSRGDGEAVEIHDADDVSDGPRCGSSRVAMQADGVERLIEDGDDDDGGDEDDDEAEKQIPADVVIGVERGAGCSFFVFEMLLRSHWERSPNVRQGAPCV